MSIQNELKSRTNLEVSPNIIAVTKTFSIPVIKPLIDHGHLHYGENKVQEAMNKWSDLKSTNKAIKLHMIGKLQSNKVKFAVPLFDYIHSLDNLKLAEKISAEQKKLKKNLKIFIQINIGNEDQKSGISIDETRDFYNYCKQINLDILGLMCIPPNNEDSSKYFDEMTWWNRIRYPQWTMVREYTKTKIPKVVWEMKLLPLTTDSKVGWTLFGSERLN